MTDPSAPPTRPAHLGDILSFTTDLMCAPGNEPALLRLAGFMVGRNLFPWQLLIAGPLITPALREQFPALAAIPRLDTASLPRPERAPATKAWLNDLIAEHGMTHHVRRLPDDVWRDRDPIADWHEATGGKPLIVKLDLGGGNHKTIVNPAPGTLVNEPFDPGSRTFFAYGMDRNPGAGAAPQH